MFFKNKRNFWVANTRPERWLLFQMERRKWFESKIVILGATSAIDSSVTAAPDSSDVCMIEASADSTNGTNNTNRKELATLMAVCVPAKVGLSGAVLKRGWSKWNQTEEQTKMEGWAGTYSDSRLPYFENEWPSQAWRLAIHRQRSHNLWAQESYLRLPMVAASMPANIMLSAVATSNMTLDVPSSSDGRISSWWWDESETRGGHVVVTQKRGRKNTDTHVLASWNTQNIAKDWPEPWWR
jgi:hypothetical protein